ncbi:HAD-IIB family hydrolase [Alloyangia pacifica]|uniref:Mannosyl-3-phosphoglycerate phosphatase n=1 Tax=Alloyangia pacifica TaxID=311180 RepID=A0A1I6WA81_9RHOB|nr:HAD-IIB family hydrolase [Alloyangia pacifica]SDI51161.1 mannosyl-3-phosphoglycerate phosphatase [Alloyangia pacifica]SFT22903.1 mannosyl-3-phosphoglycerate phosphatase [Alloyangia pacifica]
MRLAVFTDLDGTLLDHGSYSYAAAQPALDALKQRDIPLILASSKTAAEIAPLHAELGLGDWPAIVENGADRISPGTLSEDAPEYEKLRAALADLPDYATHFQGFGDMDAEGVARVTGLLLENAALARKRRFTEPGLWSGSDAEQDAFLEALAEQGIHARKGGRFLTLSFGGTKAQQMAGIMADLGCDTSIALGDAPNDIEMIETATRGVIIRNDHGNGIPPLPGEQTGRIRRTALPGPDGWNAAILDLLADLGL